MTTLATTSATRPDPPATPTTLTILRNCFSAELWMFSADDTLGVGAKVAGKNRPKDRPTIYLLDASQLVAYTGKDLAMQFCSGTGAPDATQIKVVRGSASLTLDPPGAQPVTGHLTTTEVELSDGRVIAPLDVEATCIDCFPS